MGLALFIGAMLLLAGCQNQQTPKEDGLILFDDMTSPPNKVIDANNQFAFDLYSEYKSKEGNVFFSPYSISTALAMTYEGARGKTAEEMQLVFYFPDNDNLRRSSFASIYNEINKKDKWYKLSTANALWAQEDYPFLEEYLATIENFYGGKVTNLDFKRKTEESRQIINEWVEDQTNDKIKDLIPNGVLNEFTRLVLTNAIYFKGTWIKQFDKKDTREEVFRIDPGNTVNVPTMRLTGGDAVFDYAENDGLQVLELPYDGEDLSMLIILPKEDIADVEKSINPEKLSEWKSQLRNQRVDIFIPKFKFEMKSFLADTLTDMDMPTAFSDQADFSGMTGNKDFKIDAVIHQAFVEVNEEGTEAAAATAVIMGETTSMEPEPKIPEFRADHPFLFLIQQKESGNILFIGRVSDPSKN